MEVNLNKSTHRVSDGMVQIEADSCVRMSQSKSRSKSR